jgi:hypothetical protein
MIRKQPPRAKTRKQRTRASRSKKTDEIAATVAALDRIKPATPKTAKLIELFKQWLGDESGYDEETWPVLKKALDEERKRVGARRLFDG